MSVLSHFALFFTYSLVAGAIFVVPDLFPTVDAAKAWAVAVFVYFAGALTHEVLARRAREDILLRRVSAARRDLAEVRADLARLRGGAARAASTPSSPR